MTDIENITVCVTGTYNKDTKEISGGDKVEITVGDKRSVDSVDEALKLLKPAGSEGDATAGAAAAGADAAAEQQQAEAKAEAEAKIQKLEAKKSEINAREGSRTPEETTELDAIDEELRGSAVAGVGGGVNPSTGNVALDITAGEGGGRTRAKRRRPRRTGTKKKKRTKRQRKKGRKTKKH